MFPVSFPIVSSPSLVVSVYFISLGFVLSIVLSFGLNIPLIVGSKIAKTKIAASIIMVNLFSFFCSRVLTTPPSLLKSTISILSSFPPKSNSSIIGAESSTFVFTSSLTIADYNFLIKTPE